MDPDPGGQKWPTNTEKKLKNFTFWSAGCYFLKTDVIFWGFSCSLNVLYGGPGIDKLQFLIKKRWKYFQLFFSIFSKPWIRRPDSEPEPDPNSLEMLDPDPYRNSMNPDTPQWYRQTRQKRDLKNNIRREDNKNIFFNFDPSTPAQQQNNFANNFCYFFSDPMVK